MNRSRPLTMLAGAAAAPLIALAVAACGNGGGGASALPTAPPNASRSTIPQPTNGGRTHASRALLVGCSRTLACTKEEPLIETRLLADSSIGGHAQLSRASPEVRRRFGADPRLPTCDPLLTDKRQ